MVLENVKKEMAALPDATVTDTDFRTKGFHLDVQVAAELVVAAAEALDKEKFSLEAVTGVDLLTFEKPAKETAKKGEAQATEAPPAPPAPTPTPPQMEVVYDYFHAIEGCRVVVRTRIPRAKPELPSVAAVFPGANWHERETHDFFGIRFIGHPNLTPLLLPEDADFHPLLKDFTA